MVDLSSVSLFPFYKWNMNEALNLVEFHSPTNHQIEISNVSCAPSKKARKTKKL